MRRKRTRREKVSVVVEESRLEEEKEGLWMERRRRERGEGGRV